MRKMIITSIMILFSFVSGKVNAQTTILINGVPTTVILKDNRVEKIIGPDQFLIKYFYTDADQDVGFIHSELRLDPPSSSTVKDDTPVHKSKKNKTCEQEE